MGYWDDKYTREQLKSMLFVHHPQIPEWPGIELEMVVTPDGAFHWPVNAFAEQVLRMAGEMQRRRLRNDGDIKPELNIFPVKGKRGWIDKYYITEPGMSLWLVLVSPNAEAPESVKSFIHGIRKDVMKYVNRLVFNRDTPLALEAPEPQHSHAEAQFLKPPDLPSQEDVYGHVIILGRKVGRIDPSQRQDAYVWVDSERDMQPNVEDDDGGQWRFISLDIKEPGRYKLALRVYTTIDPYNVKLTREGDIDE